jgi:hypothetical protein
MALQMNLGGASDRPLLEQVWANVDSQLKGKGKVVQRYSLLGAMQVLKRAIFG